MFSLWFHSLISIAFHLPDVCYFYFHKHLYLVPKNYHFFSLNGEDMRHMLWDTAGQEEFDCITRAYYRGAQACVLAFSCVDRESFKSVGKWKRKVEEECGNIPMVLVMTKMDLLYRAEIDSFEVEKLSQNLGIKLVKTSVKENINVQKVNNKILFKSWNLKYCISRCFTT